MNVYGQEYITFFMSRDPNIMVNFLNTSELFFVFDIIFLCGLKKSWKIWQNLVVWV